MDSIIRVLTSNSKLYGGENPTEINELIIETLHLRLNDPSSEDIESNLRKIREYYKDIDKLVLKLNSKIDDELYTYTLITMLKNKDIEINEMNFNELNTLIKKDVTDIQTLMSNQLNEIKYTNRKEQIQNAFVKIGLEVIKRHRDSKHRKQYIEKMRLLNWFQKQPEIEHFTDDDLYDIESIIVGYRDDPYTIKRSQISIVSLLTIDEGRRKEFKLSDKTDKQLKNKLRFRALMSRMRSIFYKTSPLLSELLKKAFRELFMNTKDIKKYIKIAIGNSFKTEVENYITYDSKVDRSQINFKKETSYQSISFNAYVIVLRIIYTYEKLGLITEEITNEILSDLRFIGDKYRQIIYKNNKNELIRRVDNFTNNELSVLPSNDLCVLFKLLTTSYGSLIPNYCYTYIQVSKYNNQDALMKRWTELNKEKNVSSILPRLLNYFKLINSKIEETNEYRIEIQEYTPIFKNTFDLISKLLNQLLLYKNGRDMVIGPIYTLAGYEKEIRFHARTFTVKNKIMRLKHLLDPIAFIEPSYEWFKNFILYSRAFNNGFHLFRSPGSYNPFIEYINTLNKGYIEKTSYFEVIYDVKTDFERNLEYSSEISKFQTLNLIDYRIPFAYIYQDPNLKCSLSYVTKTSFDYSLERAFAMMAYFINQIKDLKNINYDNREFIADIKYVIAAILIYNRVVPLLLYGKDNIKSNPDLKKAIRYSGYIDDKSSFEDSDAYRVEFFKSHNDEVAALKECLKKNNGWMDFVSPSKFDDEFYIKIKNQYRYIYSQELIGYPCYYSKLILLCKRLISMYAFQFEYGLSDK